LHRSENSNFISMVIKAIWGRISRHLLRIYW
jgi:hypothetical protein